jgi:chemotaxis protein CheX
MSTVLSGVNAGPAAHEFFTPENLLLMDETVHEVYSTMLNLEVVANGEINGDELMRHEQTAIVGFAGALSGICEISMSAQASIAITSGMMGGMEVEMGPEVCDAMGELCNMLSGGWKNRVPGLGAACSLSVPTVIEGAAYSVRRPPHTRINRRSYNFGDGFLLLLTLLYDPTT